MSWAGPGPRWSGLWVTISGQGGVGALLGVRRPCWRARLWFPAHWSWDLRPLPSTRAPGGRRRPAGLSLGWGSAVLIQPLTLGLGLHPPALFVFFSCCHSLLRLPSFPPPPPSLILQLDTFPLPFTPYPLLPFPPFASPPPFVLSPSLPQNQALFGTMKGNRAHCGPSGFLGPSVLPQLTHLLGLQALSSARLGLSWGGGGEERGEKGGCLCLSLPGSQVHWDNFVTHLEPQHPPTHHPPPCFP